MMSVMAGAPVASLPCLGTHLTIAAPSFLRAGSHESNVARCTRSPQSLGVCRRAGCKALPRGSHVARGTAIRWQSSPWTAFRASLSVKWRTWCRSISSTFAARQSEHRNCALLALSTKRVGNNTRSGSAQLLLWPGALDLRCPRDFAMTITIERTIAIEINNSQY